LKDFCLLANWDVVGLEYDNIGCADKKCSKAFRVDVGGALLYRALGQPKGKLFNSIPTEHKTLFTIPLHNHKIASILIIDALFGYVL